MKGDAIDAVIRRAVDSDVDCIVSFNCSMAVETEGLRLDPNRVAEGVRAVLRDGSKGFYLLAFANGLAVAQTMITFEWSDWRNGTLWWIQSVYVDPRYRRRGLFSLMFRAVEEEARRNPSVCGLRLYVDSRNTEAQEVYRKLGMRKTSYEIFEIDFVFHR